MVSTESMDYIELTEFMGFVRVRKVWESVFQALVQGISPNKALQPTAAAVLVCQGQKSRQAAAAAELGR